jgi:phage recombination protein Bet
MDMVTTEIVTRNGIVDLEPKAGGWTEEQIGVIKATVAVNASNEELALFLHLATRYDLDPFNREVWFIKYGGKPTIMTGRDGYLKIAQRSPDFVGLNSGTVCEGDHFAFDAGNGLIEHRFGAKRGVILGAWAICKRKNREPAMAFVSFEEYRGQSDPWKKYPSAMICKVAEVVTLKRQFGISGLVTKEELDQVEPADPVRHVEPLTGEIVEITPQPKIIAPPVRQVSWPQVRDALMRHGFEEQAALEWGKARVTAWGKASLRELTEEDWGDLLSLANAVGSGDAADVAEPVSDAELAF